MASYDNLRHVVVTPSRDESVFLPQLVDSMVKQSIPPSEWIIVSHNSDKSSSDYFEDICEKHEWITVKSIEDTYVKSVCEAYARKQKQKQNILANFPDLKANDIQSLSESYDALTINKESSVNLKKGSSKFSREYEVNGSIAGLSKNKTSKIIEGEEGVYIVKVINEYDAEITEDTSFDLEKTQLERDAVRNGNLLVNEYITEKSDLTDNRKILR